MKRLVLYQEDLDQFTEILGEIPFKYAKPLWDFFAITINKRKVEESKREDECNSELELANLNELEG